MVYNTVTKNSHIKDEVVLIVDDFQNMRSTLRQMLLSLEYHDITPVATGEEALIKLRNRHYDIVLCDYNLGDGIDGQQVLDQARVEGTVDLSTVFIMVTAENTNEMVMGALESTPDAYLSKPFTKDLLRVRIERAVRRHQPLTTVANALSKDGIPAALNVLDTLLEQRSDNRLELLRIKAELALRNGDLDLAANTCELAQTDKTLPWALTMLGQITQQRGDITTAESLFRQSIAHTSHFMPAHDYLAELCLIQGRRLEALNILQIASERSPKSLQRQRRLAQLAVEMDRPDLAEPAWQRVLTLSRYAGAVRTADYFDLIMTIIKQGDWRQAKKRLELMEKQRQVDPQAQWWIMAAQLNYLHARAAPPERLQPILAELDAALIHNKPAPDVAMKLSNILAILGEDTRASVMMEGVTA